MNSKLVLLKNTKELLENLYTFYEGNQSGGDLLFVDELDCMIYKGKKFHYDQKIICFHNEEGIIKINSYYDDLNILQQSTIQLKRKDEEISFYNLENTSDEFKYLINIQKSINELINHQNNKKI